MKRIMICFLAVCLVWGIGLVRDRRALREELIRLHVVAASDSWEDQRIKLQVRDAVTESLQSAMAELRDTEAARAYLQTHLPRIRAVAEEALRKLGCQDTVQVSLMMEEFGRRVYDTFTLPAGIYEALRIVIGPGEGQNWWCVVFPSLCIPASSQGFEAAAVGAGFSTELTGALTGEDGYELRFFLLDVLGMAENFLSRG